MIDQGALNQLMQIGRSKGGLTNEDLRAALPVEVMTADDIALVVVHLEDAGIPVELDDSMLTPHAVKSPVDVRPVEIVTREREPAVPMYRKPEQSNATISAAAHGGAAHARVSDRVASAPGRRWSIAVGLAGVALLCLALVLLLR